MKQPKHQQPLQNKGMACKALVCARIEKCGKYFIHLIEWNKFAFTSYKIISDEVCLLLLVIKDQESIFEDLPINIEFVSLVMIQRYY